MNAFLQKVNQLNIDFIGEHKSRVEECLAKNKKLVKNEDFYPETLINKAEDFFTTKCTTLKIKAGYNPHSKMFIETPVNLSLPQKQISFKMYEFNFWNQHNLSPEQIENIPKILKIVLKAADFLNVLEKQRMKYIIERLVKSYPNMFNLPHIFSQLFENSLTQINKIYFRVLKTNMQHQQILENLDFESLAMYYCRNCMLFLCDLHFPEKFLRGNSPCDDEEKAKNMSYFVLTPKTTGWVRQQNLILEHHQQSDLHTPNDMHFQELSTYEKKQINFYYNLKIENPCLLSFWTKIKCNDVANMIKKDSNLLKTRFYSDVCRSNKDFDDNENEKVIILIDKIKLKELPKMPEKKII